MAIRAIFFLALAIGMAAVLPAGVAHAKTPTQWVAGELLVTYRAGVHSTKTDSIHRSLGITVVQDIGPLRIVRVSVPVPLLDATAYLLSRLPEVKSVEKNYLFEPGLIPNDPEYVNQWHLPKILAPQAWDVTQGAPGVVIAILDSGVDPNHPDFAGKLVAGYNTFNNTSNTADQYGHGTEVAGAAGAISGNLEGIASVAGLSPIMPVRVTSNAGGSASAANIASGIVWATDHGASVINLSFADVAGNATIRTAAEYAFNRGALVVAASGNCGCFEATADTPFILSVSATDENDTIAYFSSKGAHVDISAPGTNIWTTVMGGIYLSDSGTSLSSPIVAGVAALMFSANPGLTPSLVAQLLKSTAVDLGTTGYDTTYGSGRVNAFAAVTTAASYIPPPDITPPSVSIASPLTGASVTGTVVINVLATDDVGVATVDVFIDGVLFASDASLPYSFAWDSTTASNGAHTMRAVATDAASNSATTVLMNVTVSNVVPDTTPPTFTGITFAANSIVAGTASVNFAVNGSGDGSGSGVSGGEYWICAATCVTPAAGSGTNFTGLTATIPTAALLVGHQYTVRARIRDVAGNWSTATSSAVLTVTPVGNIFTDGFESGTLSSYWPGRSTSDTTRLGVTASTLFGAFGLQAKGNNTNYLQGMPFTAVSTFNARFYFNPNGNTGSGQDIFVARPPRPSNIPVFRVRYRWSGGPQVQIQVGTGNANSAWTNIINSASNRIEVAWQSGGSVQLFVGGSSSAVDSLTATSNSIVGVWLGSVTNGGSSTLLGFDDFSSKTTITPLFGP